MSEERSSFTLCYPEHALTPEDLLVFIELDGFSSDWKALGFDDDRLNDLQVKLMGNPDGAEVLQGTDGLREAKLRRARARSGRNTPPSDGDVWVRYVYFPEYSLIVLVTAYPGTRDELTDLEKSTISSLIARERAEFDRRAKR